MNIDTHVRTALVCIVVLLCRAALAGEVRVDRTEPAEPGGAVEIELLAGRVEVFGHGRAEVTVTGTIDDEFEELHVGRHGRSVSIEVELREQRRRNVRTAADLRIGVPFHSNLEVETISAEIAIEGLRSTVRSESISGRIDIRGPVREVEASTISGGIDVRAEAPLERGSFESVSGDITLRGALSPEGRFSFETINGTILLRLPGNTSAEFSIDTFNGEIENEFGPKARRTGDFLPSKHLGFTLGGGGARVTAEAFNGKVRLVKE